MNADFWLVIGACTDRHGDVVLDRLQVYKRVPERIGRDEISMRVNLNLPDSLFTKPTLQASITVPDDGPSPKVSVYLADQIQDVIAEQLGLKMHITADLPYESGE